MKKVVRPGSRTAYALSNQANVASESPSPKYPIAIPTGATYSRRDRATNSRTIAVALVRLPEAAWT